MKSKHWRDFSCMQIVCFVDLYDAAVVFLDLIETREI